MKTTPTTELGSERVALPLRTRRSLLQTSAVLLPIAAVWLGFLLTVDHFSGLEAQYFGLHLLLSLSLGLTLTAIRHSAKDSLPLSLVFGVFFIAYVVKFYAFVCLPDLTVSVFWMQKFYWTWWDPDLLIQAFKMVTYGFFIFSLFIFCLGFRKYPLFLARTANTAIRLQPIPVLCIVAFLAILTSAIIYFTKMALMGAPHVYLPFRIAGLVFYVRQTIIPGLFLLLVYYGVLLRSRAWLRGSIVMLILFGISDMLLRGSRGELINVLAMLFSLLYFTNSLSRTAITNIGLGAAGVLAGWPLMSFFRDYRVLGEGPVQAMGSSIMFLQTISFEEYLLHAVQNILERVAGIESFIAVVCRDVRVTPQELIDGGVTGIFTNVVLGFPADAMHSSAPSLLGWFYMVGGMPLAIVGLPLFTLVALFGWRLLSALPLRTHPVAQALWMFWVFQNVLGGALDNAPQRLMAVMAGVMACEIVFWLTTTRLSGSRETNRLKGRFGSNSFQVAEGANY